MSNGKQTMVPEIAGRRARRALREQPIEQEAIDRMLTAATLAPSCFNNQPWRFVAVTEPEMLGKVKEYLSSGNAWAAPAACIILAATKTGLDCSLNDSRDYALFDTGMACMNLMLQAQREGIIAHPIAGFKPVEIKELCGIPPEYTLITLLVCGYPGDISSLPEEKRAAETSPRDRKPGKEVICSNSWCFD